MGLMNKIKFWKKDDFSEFGDFGNDSVNPPDSLGADPNAPLADPLAQLGSDPLGMPPEPIGSDPLSQPDPIGGRVNPLASGNSPPSFDRVTQQASTDPFGNKQTASPQGDQMMGKDIEIISAKIDTVRVSVENLGHKIDNLNQRLVALEKIANDSQTQQW